MDDFLAEATPQAKLELIRACQADGHLVAMTGDGTNDAPALAQADVAVAMNSGTQAAKEAGNMVDLDSNPTKLIEIVEIGKQMLMTRGALTTFSVANDVAKYFAIIPAAFMAVYPQLAQLNVMGLGHPRLGHSFGRHFQRPDHRGPDSAGAQGRALPPARRGGAAAPQPAGLWTGRAAGALCRHQTDRHGAGRPGLDLTKGA
ncbi:potassium-transporting ATPase subunit B [Bordetella pertussis]|nr:potassium-transporting ATPase subunit B [Bordetella pertussis]